jgi:hypothetical protein
MAPPTTNRLERRQTLFGLLVAICSGSLLGCTLEPLLDVSLPSITIERSSPAQGESDVARNQEISFWFSSPLDPGSIGLRAIDVTSAGIRQGGIITYDPLEQRLTYRPSGLYRYQLTYDAVLSESLRGLRQGELVEPVIVTFTTGESTIGAEEILGPDYHRDVAPIFARSCSSAGCHGAATPANGLNLSNAMGIQATALGNESTGWPGWARIDPGAAEWSYLVYKIIGESSLRGSSMPPGESLTSEEMRTVAQWIDDGAKVDPASEAP